MKGPFQRGLIAKAIYSLLAMGSVLLADASARAEQRPAQSERLLTIASWNLRFLAEGNGQGCRPRSDADYAELRRAVEGLNADIIAFQEVENLAAARRVFDRRRYNIIMERRRAPSRGICRVEGVDRTLIRQAVGFAIRRRFRFSVRYFTDLQLDDPNLRSAVDIGLRVWNGRNLRLLGVHLNSGCVGGGTSEQCAILERQTVVLERWIDRAARLPYRFIVIGDWNRHLALPGDAVWSELDDGSPPNADLTLAGAGQMSQCDPRFTSFIDHFALDRRAAESLVSFQEITFPAGRRLSDHCPIVMRIAL